MIRLTHRWPYHTILVPRTPIGKAMCAALLDGIDAEDRKTAALFKRLER